MQNVIKFPTKPKTYDGILLGKETETAQKSAIGFHNFDNSQSSEKSGQFIIDEDEGHTLVIAPTGAGKGRNIIIPNLLSHSASVIVIDPKGENARQTARFRKEIGHEIVIIDPFNCARRELEKQGLTVNGALNPFDILDPNDENFEGDCATFAKQITGGQKSLLDGFWDNLGEEFLVSLIAYVATFEPKENRNLARVSQLLNFDDVDYNIAVIADRPEVRNNQFIYQGLSNYLNHEREKVRPSVRSTAVQHLAPFSCSGIKKAIANTSFDIEKLKKGGKITIYLVMQPDKLEAFNSVLRVWIAVLNSIITRREEAPDQKTLFILDELAQLHPFPLLRPLVTLMRGYGMRCMLFLQEASQLHRMYRDDYKTIISNCTNLVTFGMSNYTMAKDMAELLGDKTTDELFDMPDNVLCLRQHRKRSRFVERIDYLNDPFFADRFPKNRMYK